MIFISGCTIFLNVLCVAVSCGSKKLQGGDSYIPISVLFVHILVSSFILQLPDAFSAHTDTFPYVSGGFRLKYVAPNSSEALDKTD